MKCCNCTKGYLKCIKYLCKTTDMLYICDACGWNEVHLKSERPNDRPIYS